MSVHHVCMRYIFYPILSYLYLSLLHVCMRYILSDLILSIHVSSPCLYEIYILSDLILSIPVSSPCMYAMYIISYPILSIPVCSLVVSPTAFALKLACMYAIHLLSDRIYACLFPFCQPHDAYILSFPLSKHVCSLALSPTAFALKLTILGLYV